MRRGLWTVAILAALLLLLATLFLFGPWSLTSREEVPASNEGPAEPSVAAPKPFPPPAMEPPPSPAPARPSRAPAMANGSRVVPDSRSPAESVESGIYKVELGADAELRIPGPPGQLLVWIGVPTGESHIPEDMARTEGALPAVGRTARITPFAPGLEVVPAESVCMQIHPLGSSTRFQLIPKREGSFKVGAEVHLFDTADCSGAPVPQAVTALEVKVTVDRARQFGEHAGQLWTVFWNKLLEFWGALLALLFGLILFLIRKRLKKWFGYGE